MTRYPEPGRVKTRLAQALGEEGAAELHSLMARHTAEVAKKFLFKNDNHTELFIFFDGASRKTIQKWLKIDADYIAQPEGDLGYRMRYAFDTVFDKGAKSAVMVGTDCPFIDIETLNEAFKALTKTDIVTGPAHDGGYYLIGLKKKMEFLFRNIRWGTEEVLEKTVEQAQKYGLSTALLQKLHDIDRPSDLELIENFSFLVQKQ